jgi:hypothetical protein
LLDHGFTSAYSAASAKLRLDIVIRNAIAAGQIPGPRLRACGPEITVTGGLGDERRVHMYRESFAVIADGPTEIVKWARLCCREGADAIKLNISGDDLYKAAKGEMTVMSEAEIRARVEVVRDFRRKVNAHCRAAESVKRAVRCGVDVIYHCEYADAEALDLLEREKHRLFVGPAIGLPVAVRESLSALNAEADPQVRALVDRGFDAASRTYEQMRKRGIRVVIGGDYGLDMTPQGANARDIEHFVKLFGYSPTEALASATRVGAELMGMGDELGLVREGYRRFAARRRRPARGRVDPTAARAAGRDPAEWQLSQARPRCARSRTRTPRGRGVTRDRPCRFESSSASASPLHRIELVSEPEEDELGRPFDDARAMPFALRIVGHEHVARSPASHLAVGRLDLEAAAEHDDELPTRGDVPILIQPVGEIHNHAARREGARQVIRVTELVDIWLRERDVELLEA